MRHISCFGRHVSRHADWGAGMVGEDYGVGLGEPHQDAGERLAVKPQFDGDGIGAAGEPSFAVGDGEEVVQHLSVAL